MKIELTSGQYCAAVMYISHFQGSSVKQIKNLMHDENSSLLLLIGAYYSVIMTDFDKYVSQWKYLEENDETPTVASL